MAEFSLRQFLKHNRFDPAGGVRRLLPSAGKGLSPAVNNCIDGRRI
jgi:hypothetical protein